MDQQLLLMHQAMLGDHMRLQAYDRALASAVRPGDVVADVGAGTLILSFLALRHGARHVYAIEADPQVVLLARKIASHNDLGKRLTVVQGDARRVQLPEQVDTIVCEMMGYLGPEEEMAEILNAVARHNLRPGGRVVPERMKTHLQAIEFDDEGWGVWKQDFWGYALNVVQEYAPPCAQMHFFSRPPKLLSAPATVADYELGTSAHELPRCHELSIIEPGCLHAVVGYFSVQLARGVTLSNFPSYPGCNWAVWTWPVRHTPVNPGDQVRVGFRTPQQWRLATTWALDCHVARNHRNR